MVLEPQRLGCFPFCVFISPPAVSSHFLPPINWAILSVITHRIPPPTIPNKVDQVTYFSVLVQLCTMHHCSGTDQRGRWSDIYWYERAMSAYSLICSC
ncbi:hypothetical protein PR003_g6057 [Phytophthora rubi]|uniref:Uncharacterized protein n=1 Tax=Phytophthora rubi TaxID=129364 RepID=A0A6A3KEU7_9STRA|nr:hypothetical protein PR002_g17642 [Phytophthora rubi]KAE9349116.1 hypothetical protein PR003_g6057 [Phytophthora rubi]